MQQGPGNGKPLAHAGGKSGNGLFTDSGKPYLFQDAADISICFLVGLLQFQIFSSGEVFIEYGDVNQSADIFLDTFPVFPGLLSLYPDFPDIRAEETGGQLQQSGFPCAVPSGQRIDGAIRHLERTAFQNGSGCIGLAYVCNSYHRFLLIINTNRWYV